MESWPYQQPALVGAGYRVVSYSRRGHLGSSPNDGIEQAVGSADLGLLLDHLNLDRSHLVSAAYGGFFATDYAFSHPDRVRSLTVLSSFI
ncbi:alpha/beta hydrolase, partial [Aeromicrobium alkaliterrae]|uniref:alpha/beta fold hydrolase n=1 Tax=Aeromicrobium alkaliterrae TaxID=302168 RepID=UPI0031DC5726